MDYVLTNYIMLTFKSRKYITTHKYITNKKFKIITKITQ